MLALILASIMLLQRNKWKDEEEFPSNRRHQPDQGKQGRKDEDEECQSNNRRQPDQGKQGRKDEDEDSQSNKKRQPDQGKQGRKDEDEECQSKRRRQNYESVNMITETATIDNQKSHESFNSGLGRNNAPSSRGPYPPPSNETGPSRGPHPPPSNETGPSRGPHPPPSNETGPSRGPHPPPSNETGPSRGPHPPPSNETGPSRGPHPPHHQSDSQFNEDQNQDMLIQQSSNANSSQIWSNNSIIAVLVSGCAIVGIISLIVFKITKKGNDSIVTDCDVDSILTPILIPPEQP